MASDIQFDLLVDEAPLRNVNGAVHCIAVTVIAWKLGLLQIVCVLTIYLAE
jgi:hypothetical protein